MTENKTPQMRDLYRYVIRLYATEWRVVGLELNLKTAKLDTISKDNPNNSEACFEKPYTHGYNQILMLPGEC